MRLLPRSALEGLYRGLDGVGQDAQVLRANEFVVHPDRLSETIATSVEQLAGYDNQHEAFYPEVDAAETRRSLPPLEADIPGSTVKVASLLTSRPAWKAGRTQAFGYVDRELRPMRTTGGAKYQDAATGAYLPASGTPLLDLLLVDAADRTPIVGEVKIGGDQNLFYALIQGLMHVAALANTHQRTRLARFHPSIFDTDTKLDLFLLTVAPPTAGTRLRLAWLAEVAAFQQMQLPGATSILRQIVCLNYMPDEKEPHWHEKWRY
jgi:hypothetical protein